MALSGLYIGIDQETRRLLHLRVDLDQAVPDALVLNRISGDIFELLDDREQQGAHEFSWHVDVPATASVQLPFAVEGPATVLGGRAVGAVHVQVGVRRGDGRQDALVSMTVSGEARSRSFTCRRRGPWFREVRFEFDVCRTAVDHNGRPREFREPRYTPGRFQIPAPAGFTRTVSVDSALLEAGVKAERRRRARRIDDRGKTDGWDDSELDDALRQQLAARSLDDPSAWPRWFMWCFLATRHVGKQVRGVMFDSEAPARQGCAVFAGQDDFAALPDGEPSSREQALALRFYLFTWMHEIGHGFNLHHSSDEGKSGALSWMNFQPATSKQGAFWKKFGFAFDPDELLHLRHGDFSQVVMGGDRLEGSGMLAAPRSRRLGSIVPLGRGRPRQTLEVLLRSRGSFDFMAPVKIEMRLKNRAHTERVVFDDLQPEGSRVVVLISRPDGRVVEYMPLLRKIQRPTRRTLAAGRQAHGADRYSQELDLTYGRGGFYFDTPGAYQIRLLYFDGDHGVVASNSLPLRIGYPSRTCDGLAQDFFADDVGRCLYLRGSHAKYLERRGLNVLRDLAARWVGTARGCDLVDALVPGVARPFWQVREGNVEKIKKPDPSGVLTLTEPALRFLESAEARTFNLGHDRLVWARVRQMTLLSQQRRARQELARLYKRLKQRGVNPSVLTEVLRTARKILGQGIEEEL
jgi:hypothetical protein